MQYEKRLPVKSGISHTVIDLSLLPRILLEAKYLQ